jgi:hypothetical protein
MPDYTGQFCREIQIMENQNPGYAPSFLLR